MAGPAGCLNGRGRNHFVCDVDWRNSPLAISPNYDRERARRYKKWWSRQRGAPQGELIEVPAEVWQRRKVAAEQKSEQERASS